MLNTVSKNIMSFCLCVIYMVALTFCLSVTSSVAWNKCWTLAGLAQVCSGHDWPQHSWAT